MRVECGALLVYCSRLSDTLLDAPCYKATRNFMLHDCVHMCALSKPLAFHSRISLLSHLATSRLTHDCLLKVRPQVTKLRQCI
eukprot:3006997-Amphidinium_carterae.1